MASYLQVQWTVLLLGFMLMISGAMGAAPREPVNVPFGRNYAPTWAFDHIKYFNGGSDIQLHLDKYTGKLTPEPLLHTLSLPFILYSH
ncbi:Concanavalin A-like lectin/glucanase domain containing protein [Parasponia andersonii]|uniref:Concanavalin A-like lectin/glucanase domain containing protein n=1 Tax=Parasponia andersonii TaxID=3476 RepID=A0A2P5AD95_PARAD|nr:Concanavalin A-like lectin/glucanase domain containing protein [Parasponia andersonii]